MNEENEILSRKLEREREARQQAESLLEEKSLMLYESNKKLIRLNKLLENVIELRTKKLSEREHEYFAIVESIADIICKVNLQGEITFANQIASEIFKGIRMELLGRSI
jgi:PAS domain-containing protein